MPSLSMVNNKTGSTGPHNFQLVEVKLPHRAMSQFIHGGFFLSHLVDKVTVLSSSLETREC